jgi:hypothetical protein
MAKRQDPRRVLELSLTRELDAQQTAPEVSIALTVDEISQRPEPILRIVCRVPRLEYFDLHRLV